MSFLHKILIAAGLFLLFTFNLNATDIIVSKQKGTTAKEQFKNAYNKANKGDVILIDKDIHLKNTDKPFLINKSDLTFKGKYKKAGKYQFVRNDQKNITFRINASNITLENLGFKKASQIIVFGNREDKIIKNTKVISCHFKDGKYTGIDFRGNFKNTQIINSTFNNCKFSVQTMDCNVLENFLVDRCQFIKGDHQISLDNPHAKNLRHQNIKILNTKFELCDRFNIALANTQNVTIANCTLMGGTGPYSQGLHIEDRTQNVKVIKNTITCMADVAILLYATDKIGHGTGRRLTEDEKIASGCGNILLDHNTITSGKADAAISVGYGKGYFKIYGNNIISSSNKGLNTFKSKNMSFEINDNTLIKGKKYKTIKTITNPKEKETFVRIR
ncbi:right-handed parallel beta-helix repeat-containing protein [Wenyingzhuangia sp. IMCC45574]